MRISDWSSYVCSSDLGKIDLEDTRGVSDLAPESVEVDAQRRDLYVYIICISRDALRIGRSLAKGVLSKAACSTGLRGTEAGGPGSAHDHAGQSEDAPCEGPATTLWVLDRREIIHDCLSLLGGSSLLSPASSST